MAEGYKWLNYAQQLQTIARAGLAYSKDKYDQERFEEILNISMDILSNYAGIEKKRISDLFICEVGYPTPKVDVRAAVFRNDKILMVREKKDGLWSLPGGWADAHLSLRENLIKEAKEEAGAKIEPQRIIAILDRKKHNTPPMPFGVYVIFAECTYLDGEFKNNIETSARGFFAPDELPPLSQSRNSEEQIRMCFRSRGEESLEPFFD